jgi:uncharacterized protein YjbI with pentapeptide repeats
LQEASIPLLKIDKVENYLRAVDSKNIDTTTNTKIKSYECIDKKMRNGVESFNGYVQGSIIHLPYLNLYEIFNKRAFDLSMANLSGADLYKSNLLGANLSGANLSGANLSGADLSMANLSGANSSRADLSMAKLFGTDLSMANLSGANLSRAELFESNLSGTNLYNANLSGANLSMANLSGANLSRADLSGTNLYKSNLSGAILPYSILIGIEPENYKAVILNTKSNFERAICDNADFIYCIGEFTENIPRIMNNKKELKSELERRVFDKQKLQSILEISKLTE